MTFKEAYAKMLSGSRITRPAFRGFWYINPVNGKVTIHLSSGKEITYGQIDLTLKNCMAEDWEVMEDEPAAAEEAATKTEA